jgi:hypothetical protein
VLRASALLAPLVSAQILVSAATGEAMTIVFIVPMGLLLDGTKVTALPETPVALQTTGEPTIPTYSLPSAMLPLKARL